MTTIPDSLPTLSAGPHSEGSGEACVMEYVSVLTGDVWTDKPKSTNIVIAKLAQGINDGLLDSERHMLVPLIDRLASAGGSPSRFLERAKRLLDPTYYCYDEEELGEAAYTIGQESTHRWNVPNKNYDRSPDLAVALLSDLLAVHEKLRQREVQPITPEALAKAKALIESQHLITVS